MASGGSHLAQLWKDSPKVPLGGIELWELKKVQWRDIPGANTAVKTFSTAEFYGCTIVLVADGKHALIGHFHQERTTGNVMDDNAQVKEYIIDKLLDKFAEVDWDNGSHAWIIHSSSSTSVGYTTIKEFLEENEIPSGNIYNHPYFASSGVGEFPGGPKGKALLQYEKDVKGGGAILSVYIQNDKPLANKFNYNSKGEPV